MTKRLSTKRLSAKRLSIKRISKKLSNMSAKKVSSLKKMSAKRMSAKRMSAKKMSAKKMSAKKVSSVKRLSSKKVSSVKRLSSKKMSAKKMSPKKVSSVKRKSPKKVSSHYKMRGMGVLLNMYGGASEALEQQVSQKLNEISSLKAELLSEKNEERKRKIQQTINKIEGDVNIAKEKMKQLLMGAADSVSKAVSALGSSTSKIGSDFLSRLSSGLKKSQPTLARPLTPPAPVLPPPYSFTGGKVNHKLPSDKYQRRIEKRFSYGSDSDSNISLSMTGGSENASSTFKF